MALCQLGTHVAVEQGQTDAVVLLLGHGAQISAAPKTGSMSALQKALQGTSPGCADVIKLLVDAGADINCYDAWYQRDTAVHVAIRAGSPGNLEALLAAGVQPFLLNGLGQVPLFVAMSSTHPNAAPVLKALLHGMRAAAARDLQDDTQQSDTKRTTECSPVDLADTATIRCLEQHPSSSYFHSPAGQAGHSATGINMQDEGGNTALHLAAAAGRPDLVAVLLEAGVSVNTTNNQQNTPLHLAAKALSKPDEATVLQLLLDAGAQPNAAGCGGYTALHIAAEGCHTDALKVLLAAGADVNAATRGWTVLHLALDSSLAPSQIGQSISVLLDAGANTAAASVADRHTPLHCAALNGQLEAMQLLLAAGAGAGVNAVSDDGSTPLICALGETGSDEGRIAVMKVLLAAGASLPYCKPGRTGGTILHIAARAGDAAAVHLLLLAGADVQAVADAGCTPIHAALERSNSSRPRDCLEPPDHSKINKVVQLLLEASACVESQLHTNGDRPLHLAAALGSTAAVRLLLAAGADVTAERSGPELDDDFGFDDDGPVTFRTILDLAALSGDLDTVQLVLSALEDAASPSPVTVRVLTAAIHSWSAGGVAVLRHLLLHRQKYQQRALSTEEAVQLVKSIQQTHGRFSWHSQIPSSSCKLHDYLAALLFHTAIAGPACPAGEAAEDQIQCSTYDGVWQHASQSGAFGLDKLGLAMFRAWAADTAVASEQHLVLVRLESDAAQLHARVSQLALMLAAERKREREDSS